MKRKKFPEKVPFRLTRMLINTMEIAGINGTFRHTCELVLKMLRMYKDSLEAVLEAFVYDPLLNCRLIAEVSKYQSKSSYPKYSRTISRSKTIINIQS